MDLGGRVDLDDPEVAVFPRPAVCNLRCPVLDSVNGEAQLPTAVFEDMLVAHIELEVLCRHRARSE
jgi:hypothetical protein